MKDGLLKDGWFMKGIQNLFSYTYDNANSNLKKNCLKKIQ